MPSSDDEQREWWAEQEADWRGMEPYAQTRLQRVFFRFMARWTGGAKQHFEEALPAEEPTQNDEEPA